MLDVAVVGGGPAGSRTAFRLAGMGYKVVVLEKRPGLGEKPCCTGIVSRECADAFSIPDEVIYRKVNSASVFSPSGEQIRLSRPETQACILKRADFDRLLAEKAISAGAEYQVSTEVKNIVIGPDGVEIESEKQGHPVNFSASAVVLAPGFSSRLSRNLGFRRPGYFVSGAQVEVEAPGIAGVEVYFSQNSSPGFFSWIVPTRENRCLVGLLSRTTPGVYLARWLSGLEEKGRISLNGDPLHYGGIPLRPLSRTFRDRMLVVGDAAGQVKPTTGGGIYFGLLCADLAAESLDRAFKKGDLSSGELALYEAAWHKKLGSELQKEYFARKLYERLNDRQIDSLFLRLKQSGLVDSLLAQSDLSFDWHGGLLLKAVRPAAASGVKHILRFPARLFQR